MGDTQTLERGITGDAPARWRLTDAAVDRLKRATGISSTNKLAAHLHYSRMKWWRLRNGLYDIRMSEARQLADIARWSLDRMFERVTPDA